MTDDTNKAGVLITNVLVLGALALLLLDWLRRGEWSYLIVVGVATAWLICGAVALLKELRRCQQTLLKHGLRPGD